ncbi:axonemal dynein light intermediate polypeptide 1-like [Eucyclogobius newberryi]|uniref:axonemal dynein light intermediate polypeptide 1-like n=1 Tax=Eucyclogobius newberryi TaxID=166745 RepID=UPI003B5B6628
MIPPPDSLLKYDNPVLVSRRSGAKSPKSFKVNPQQSPETSPVPPLPKPQPGPSKQQSEELLNCILPPREWEEGTKLWIQNVSSAPSTRTEVIQLSEELDIKLKRRKARLTGICPVRRELFSQCFDELIRQVTIHCAERGLLLLRLRDEIEVTITAYQTIYETSVAFGMRKALQSENGKSEMEEKIAALKNEKQELIKQLNEQKAKCEAVEKREDKRRRVEEKKHSDEIQFLKRANEQLKDQLEEIVTSKLSA